MNIYHKWVHLCRDEYNFIFRDEEIPAPTLFDFVMTDDKCSRRLDWILELYQDHQIKKIIAGIEDNTQYEASYLSPILLHLMKSHLRQRKLNQLI
jgi:hypothetical protein